MSRCLMGAVLAGIIVFIWGAISWMVLPWHMATLKKFTDETGVAQVIQTNAPASGIYLLPMSESETQLSTIKPSMFAAVNTEGMSASMVPAMIIGLISQIVAALLIAWLLYQTSGLTYFGRVAFVVVFALAASIVTHGAEWNWFHFDTKFILVSVADLLIGWFLGGLILAKFCRRA